MKIIKQGVAVRKNHTFFGYEAWPSACIDENGTIYVVSSGCRMGHVCPFGKILLYKSRDGGESFGPPSIIQDDYLDDRDPGIVYLGGGKMFVSRFAHPAERYTGEFHDWIYSDSGEAGDGLLRCYDEIPPEDAGGGSFYRLCHDYGEKIGEEKHIPVHSPHGPIVLSDNTLFYFGKVIFPCEEEKGKFLAYVSRDEGETFEKAGECRIPEGYDIDTFHEVHCCEFEGGRIIAFFRSHLTEDDHYFTIMTSYSDDGGRTWSKWEKTGICGSPPHLCKLPDGGAVLTYGRRIPPYGIYGRRVSPKGEIGEEEFFLAPCDDNDIGYPSSVVRPDGKIFTVYYARYKGDKRASLLYTLWEIDRS